MAIPIGDVYKLIQKYTWLGQTAYNVLHYARNGGTGDAGDLLTAWYNDMTDLIREVLNSLCVQVGTEVYSLSDPQDFVIDTYSLAGADLGDPMAKFDSHSFTKYSPTKDIRSGGIRIPGPSDEMYSAGAPIGTAATNLNAIATAFSGDIVGNGWPFKLCLYTPGNLATGGVATAVWPSSVQNNNLTTQSSRKR